MRKSNSTNSDLKNAWNSGKADYYSGQNRKNARNSKISGAYAIFNSFVLVANIFVNDLCSNQRCIDCLNILETYENFQANLWICYHSLKTPPY